jgi:AbrB family looped-hinge helix DNA binding protein
MTSAKVGPKGQVVIPKQIRDALGIEPGGRVEIEREGREVRVRKPVSASQLRGMLPRSEAGLADIEAEHRRELAAEEGRAAGWNK